MKKALFQIMIFATFYFLLFTFYVYGQSISWQRLFPDYYGVARKVQQASDGGYIAVGNVLVNGESKMRLLKLNLHGDTLWSKIIGVGITNGYWIETTFDSGFIIGGSIDSGTTLYKVYLLKTDSLGNIIWHKTYANSEQDACICVKQTPDGGFILSCITWPFMSDRKIWLIKTDSNGTSLWQKIYGDGIITFVAQEIQILDNGYILTGFKEVGAFSDVLLMKFNINGDTLWTKTFGGNNIDYGKSVIALPFINTCVIAGYTQSYSSNNKPETYVIKTDTNGLLQWQKTYSNLGWDNSNCVRYKPNTGYVLAGYSDSLNNLIFKAKIRFIDFSGNVLFEKSYNPEVNGDAEFKNIDLTDDGGFIIGGYSSTPSSESMYIVKTDSSGFANPIGINNNQNDMPHSFKLYQNFPNPFNSQTKLKFEIPHESKVILIIYNVLGQEIVTLINENLKAGSHQTAFDANNLPSGIYFATLFAGGFKLTKKIVLLN